MEPIVHLLEHVPHGHIENRMATGAYDFWIIVGHVRAADDGRRTNIPLSDSASLPLASLNFGKVAGGEGGPLVVLAGCRAASFGADLHGMAGLPMLMDRAGVGAFIAPFFDIDRYDGLRFLRTLFEYLEARRTSLGDSLRLARRDFPFENGESWLLFGNPTATILERNSGVRWFLRRRVTNSMSPRKVIGAFI